ncbi:uncharacterized protein LOC128715579 [Anopheles marshallii]|uniref:uncharacterized protein LOC128715579 n=1 Tax=Anopheles marshallii TaxID=1521116 RepID=UPI00237C345E|nr:uncharacterized protein LOC128715579 [Anopheles marshallii]
MFIDKVRQIRIPNPPSLSYELNVKHDAAAPYVREAAAQGATFTPLRLLLVPIFLMSQVQQIAGQFKIVNLNTANLTSSSSNRTTGSVNFVQIKPIVIANSSTFTELPAKSANEASRALQQDKFPAMMVENKFIKLSIVNSTTFDNKTRERKIQQAVANARQNELPTEIWVKTHRPLTDTKFASVVGYAKKSKIRSMMQTELDDPPKKSTATSSKSGRNKYRNFKSRCRCERIWNCVRIQISVARCAPDFFMCCF